MNRIHFLNVGHGDCTIIEHASGRITMVDINNSDSLDGDTRRELAEEYGITGLDYVMKSYLADTLRESFRRSISPKSGIMSP